MTTDLSGEKFTEGKEQDVVARCLRFRTAKWENVVPVAARLPDRGRQSSPRREKVRAANKST